MNTRPATTIAHDVILQLVGSATTVNIPAVLRYETSDPFAVHIIFRHAGPDHDDVEWSFARSLLADGLGDPAGLGDVLVWPEEVVGRAVLCLSLSSPSGMALFEADGEQIELFLAATYAAVPAGTEISRVNLDNELAELLWRANRG